jgi:hypothetical protein
MRPSLPVVMTGESDANRPSIPGLPHKNSPKVTYSRIMKLVEVDTVIVQYWHRRSRTRPIEPPTRSWFLTPTSGQFIHINTDIIRSYQGREPVAIKKYSACCVRIVGGLSQHQHDRQFSGNKLTLCTNTRERCDLQTEPIVQILSGFSGATCPSTVLAAFRNAGVFLIINKDYEGTVIIYRDGRLDTPRCEVERLARKEAVMAAMCAENYEDADLDTNEPRGRGPRRS